MVVFHPQGENPLNVLLPVSLSSGSSIILYGSNGWTFPEQGVNLTLSYPTSDTEIRRKVDNYLITGYEVLLFTDGTECTGSIASGGLMRNHITLNFAVSGITMLSYEFWLYGVPGPARVGGGKAHQNYNLMC
ncbi:uncharacterized protein LOC134799944 [Cydia splendana]|uniref:uncharacterized protein LOC134799944 n=1 Tax=Cydia splendana TaxID=1100963 RepID=UPI00300D0987